MDNSSIDSNTKLKIFNALISFVDEKAIYDVTVAELTRKIGINRGTFYLYFSDISDAILQIETILTNKIVKVLETTNALHSGNGLELDMYKAITQSISKNRDAYMALLGVNGDQRFANHLKQRLVPFIGSNGVIKTSKNSNIPVNFAEDFIINSIFNVVLFWITNNSEVPYEKVADIIYETRRLTPLEIAGAD
ncbi:MAG: TetR/AcrR family transcriptional regulator [Liquorilactobacillus satsumensis]|uniref:TetR/AcrR family transcriptional regulator n=1 Tax=Lactobacillaceae TaxID=33958 RepID=UPI001E5CBD88|nr:TetR/AcrR family transcriptional regulator [Leuconostoc pseudomesenteroides]MCC8439795.1 hypothetical protein [Leuconostoc pseudomesenteroides]